MVEQEWGSCWEINANEKIMLLGESITFSRTIGRTLLVQSFSNYSN